MSKLFSPSVMCLSFDHLAEEVRALDAAGADRFHIDIMDGSFVPNFAVGLQDISVVRRHTKKPLECHLMVENPIGKLDPFVKAGADIIIVHAEAERYVGKTLRAIRERGLKAGLGLNPDTSLESVREILPYADTVLVMTVEPGFAGQKYLEHVTDKIRRLGELKQQYGFEILVDGAVSHEKIRELSALGADVFVLGTSSKLLPRCGDYAERIRELRT